MFNSISNNLSYIYNKTSAAMDYIPGKSTLVNAVSSVSRNVFDAASYLVNRHSNVERTYTNQNSSKFETFYDLASGQDIDIEKGNVVEKALNSKKLAAITETYKSVLADLTKEVNHTRASLSKTTNKEIRAKKTEEYKALIARLNTLTSNYNQIVELINKPDSASKAKVKELEDAINDEFIAVNL